MTEIFKFSTTFLCFVVLNIFSCNAIPIQRGLIIGLGQYEDTNWAKINSDNDVRYVVRMLEQIGYTALKH